MKKRCESCGKVFKPNSNAQLYCSATCYEKAKEYKFMNEDEKQAYEELKALATTLCSAVLYEPLGADETDMKLASECIRDAYSYLKVNEEDED